MLRPRVIPVLLLQGTGLVKTIKFKDPKYVGDPINAIKIFNEKAVDELIFLDITATPENKKPNLKIISEIASECFMPVCYGGGVNDIDDLKKIFHLGIEKVCICSHAVQNPDFIKQAADIYGSQSIVVCLDFKKNLLGKYEIWVNGGRKKVNRDPFELIEQFQTLGAGEIFINSIDRDGTGEGYDLALIEKVSSLVDIPIIACGGAGQLSDIAKILGMKGVAAAAGSLFTFYGQYRAVLINYPTRQELNSLIQQHKDTR